MRTTITLEPDVARIVEETMRRDRRSFKDVVNGAIRSGLSPKREKKAARFVARSHHTGLEPGFDSRRLNQLVDELEAEAAMAVPPRPRSRK